MIYNFVTDFIIETVFAFPFSKYDDITTFTTFNTTLSVFIMYLHKTLVWVNDIGPFEKMTVVRSINYKIKMRLFKKKIMKTDWMQILLSRKFCWPQVHICLVL